MDDQPEGLVALEATLAPLGQRLVHARSGREALRHLLHQDFAVVLMDVVMPDMDGFETAQLIRERERSRNTPILFLTALSRGQMPELRAYAVGAVDYLLKPFEPDILRSKVSVFVDLFRKTELVRRQAEALRQAQQREHEQALAEAHQRVEAEHLQQAVRLRDEFLSMASHELKTPLTSLKPAQLQARCARRPRRAEPLPWPEQRGAQLETLERQRAAGSRSSWTACWTCRASPPGGMELRAGARWTWASWCARWPRRFEPRGRARRLRRSPGCAPSRPWWATGTGCGWSRCVTNLLSNALKYGAGKPVELRVRARRTGSARLEVRDEGIGIAPEDARAHLRALRARRAPWYLGGFGLGLWIVQQIVRPRRQRRRGEHAGAGLHLPGGAAA